MRSERLRSLKLLLRIEDVSSATHWLNLVQKYFLRFCILLSFLLTKSLLGENEAGVVIGEVFDEDTKGPLGVSLSQSKKHNWKQRLMLTDDFE